MNTVDHETAISIVRAFAELHREYPPIKPWLDGFLDRAYPFMKAEVVAFRLRYFEGKTCQEVAKHFGVSPYVARKMISKATEAICTDVLLGISDLLAAVHGTQEKADE